MSAPTLPLVAAPRGGARFGSDVILASRELDFSGRLTSAGGGYEGAQKAPQPT